ncbi:hypothetical protein G7Z17_g3501 [Cylindrodendrum hubeiense]|uniref:MARVEL domain-containing protein n=1 Tax=Cylindrodendrum hubeiense TaxID=595255 RepID=A0A9P5HGT2_9HYPO|nr:hypothetical protein G7Z17_g3501 [Cylindrodendrum hubeiense]
MAQANTIRPKGKEHFPHYPPGFTVLRIFQFVFALVILAIVSYTVYIVPVDGNCLMLFTAVATLISSLYMIIANQCAPQLYNYWAVMSLDIFLLIFWLISFALLAAETAYFWAAGTYYCGYYSCYYGTLEGSALVLGAILAAAAGLGALEFLFFFISLIIHSVAMCRHRRAGLHCNAAPAGTAPAAVAVPVQIQPQQVQPMANYQGVPQYAVPVGQNPAFNTQSVYNPAAPPQGFPPQQQLGEKQGQPQFFPPQGQQQQQQQQFYNQPPPPIMPQPTGGSLQQSPAQQSPPAPPQATYQPPYNQPTPPPVAQAGYQAPAQLP